MAGICQPMKVFIGIHCQELENWTVFFCKHTSAFPWIYSDLKGIPPEIGEHRMILEEKCQTNMSEATSSKSKILPSG